MASVSGRSVGVGSEVGDLTVEVTSDDTPQASGMKIDFVLVDFTLDNLCGTSMLNSLNSVMFCYSC